MNAALRINDFWRSSATFGRDKRRGRDLESEQFTDGPAMVSQLGSHRRGALNPTDTPGAALAAQLAAYSIRNDVEQGEQQQ